MIAKFGKLETCGAIPVPEYQEIDVIPRGQSAHGKGWTLGGAYNMESRGQASESIINPIPTQIMQTEPLPLPISQLSPHPTLSSPLQSPCSFPWLRSACDMEAFLTTRCGSDPSSACARFACLYLTHGALPVCQLL